jgi:hypothetical protein
LKYEETKITVRGPTGRVRTTTIVAAHLADIGASGFVTLTIYLAETGGYLVYDREHLSTFALPTIRHARNILHRGLSRGEHEAFEALAEALNELDEIVEVEFPDDGDWNDNDDV